MPCHAAIQKYLWLVLPHQLKPMPPIPNHTAIKKHLGFTSPHEPNPMQRTIPNCNTNPWGFCYNLKSCLSGRTIPALYCFSRPLLYNLRCTLALVVTPVNHCVPTTVSIPTQRSHPGRAWQDMDLGSLHVKHLHHSHLKCMRHMPNQICKPRWEIKSHRIPLLGPNLKPLPWSYLPPTGVSRQSSTRRSSTRRS